jgi:FkbM family methyltransferase
MTSSLFGLGVQTASLLNAGVPTRSALRLASSIVKPDPKAPLQEARLPRFGAFTFRKTRSDAYAVIHNLVRDQYRPPAAWLSDLLSRATARQPQGVGLFVDLGAHIGTSARYFASEFPAASVIAIEPDPDNYRLLVANVSRIENVVHLRRAAAEVAGQRVFLSGDGDSVQTSSGADAASDGVETVSISSILASRPECVPLLLKVDIEGAESSVLLDPGCWRFPLIVAELHEWMTDLHGSSLAFSHGHAKAGRVLLSKGENVWSVDLDLLEALA